MDELDRPYHPIANLFPLMQGGEFDQLKASIQENGLLEPITLLGNGSIVDGRNRHRACIETDTPPRFEQYQGAMDTTALWAYVKAKNADRRHLTSSQWAAIAIEADELIERLEEEARERQLATRAQPGQQVGGGNNSTTYEEPAKTRDALADMFDTNPRYIQDAKRLQRDAPDLLEQVKGGTLTIPKAKKELGERNGRPHVTHNSGNNEWYTPPEYIEAARATMERIDLDPASSDKANEIVQAATYYTAQDDGLAQEWRGRVWMNPPYSSDLIGSFCDKLAQHAKAGNVPEACVLVNNATETGWFNALLDVASALCLIRGRVKFIDENGNPSGAPLQGQVVIYIGPASADFEREFSQFGRVLYATW